MNNKNNLTVFTKILSFLNELNDSFGTKYPNVFLYYKLCKKTTVSNTNAINKHVDYFSRFLIPNKEHIIGSNFINLDPNEIRFDTSEKVFINIQEIIKNTDKENREIIFKHLQFLLYMVSPDNDEVKNALVKKESKTSDSKETVFINNFLNTFQDSMKETTSQEDLENVNPFEMAMKLVKNGAFSQMTSQMKNGIESGELKLDSLLGSVQGMLKNLTSELNEKDALDPTSKQLINSIPDLLNPSNVDSLSSENITSGLGTNPLNDVGSILSMMSPLLSGLGGGQNSSNPISNMLQDPSAILQMVSGMSQGLSVGEDVPEANQGLSRTTQGLSNPLSAVMDMMAGLNMNNQNPERK